MEISWEIDGGVITLLIFWVAMMLILAMVHYDLWNEPKDYTKHASKRR